MTFTPLNKLTKALVVGLSLSTVTAAAQEQQLDDVVKAGSDINQSANRSQQRIDKMNDQVVDKLQTYKALNKEIDGLTVYNQQMQAQLDNQLIELQQLGQSIEQVSIIERQISPLMARMITTLDTFVSLDVPFLPEERQHRLADLKGMMERSDVSTSEKFRRVLEAYQVEVDYGRTIEAYQGEIDIDGTPMNVDFLRIGRVSFLYQSRDGLQLGQWDQASQSWQKLPASYRTSVNKALRIARKQLAPDLITVPVNLAKSAAE
ncbi:DUF3450 domain-containing protein [Thalassotalea agarivorans]|uniref:TonB system biopolymer transport component n=1 Tax=Thalassotalea agarivorans TaxID=349064 RepID=A0A1I0EJU1_THASX|nr:DUF3450 domain-containing protein [Thalassotalea agarivorans]SET45714.1 Protein of unknown function [Thalassotalea agarivorans]